MRIIIAWGKDAERIHDFLESHGQNLILYLAALGGGLGGFLSILIMRWLYTGLWL